MYFCIRYGDAATHCDGRKGIRCKTGTVPATVKSLRKAEGNQNATASVRGGKAPPEDQVRKPAASDIYLRTTVPGQSLFRFICFQRIYAKESDSFSHIIVHIAACIRSDNSERHSD